MADHFAEAWAEFERLRQLVPGRADWHLHNWGVWRHGDHVTDGYDSKSAGVKCGGISGEDAFEHLCEPVDEWAAEVCDAIIDGLSPLHRCALSNVYEASVMTFRPGYLEKVLVDAARVFWDQAQKRDLM